MQSFPARESTPRPWQLLHLRCLYQASADSCPCPSRASACRQRWTRRLCCRAGGHVDSLTAELHQGSPSRAFACAGEHGVEVIVAGTVEADVEATDASARWPSVAVGQALDRASAKLAFSGTEKGSYELGCMLKENAKNEQPWHWRLC